MDLDALLGILFFIVFVVLPMITGARKKGRGQSRPQQGAPGQGRAGQAGTPAAQGRPGAPAGGSPAQGGPVASSSQRGDHPASATLEEIRRRVQEAQERERQREAERSSGRRGQTTASARQSSGSLVSSDPFEGRLVSASGKTISGEPLGREGSASQWPPPEPDLLAGRQPTSVIGREGAGDGSPRGTITGRPSTLGREGVVGSSQQGGARQTSGGLGRMGAPSGGLGREGAVGGGLGRMGGPPGGLGREGEPKRRRRATTLELGSASGRPETATYGAKVGRAALVNADREGILRGLIWHEILKEAPGKKLLRRTRSRPQ